MNGLNMKQWNFQRHLFGFDGLLLISDNVGVILLLVGSLGVIHGTPKQKGEGESQMPAASRHICLNV